MQINKPLTVGTKLNRCGDEERALNLDEAVLAVGIGWYHFRLLLLSGSIFALDAMQIQILTFAEDGVRASFGLGSALFSLAASAVFGGMFFGSIGAGRISDMKGRKFATLVATLFITVGGTVVCTSPYFSILVIGYFILGLGSGGLHPAAALFMEFMPTHRRLIGLILFTSFFTTGMMFECLVAYALQNYSWRWLTAASLSPVIVAACALPIWDESPRFLVLNNRHEEAVAIIKKIARMNGTTHCLPTLFTVVVAHDTDGDPREASTRIETPRERSMFSDLKVLFGTTQLRHLTFILFTVWTAASLGYYGLILLVGDIKLGDMSKFASTAVVTSSEYPSFVAQYLLGTYIGRKPTFVVASAALAVLFPVIQATKSTPAPLRLFVMYITRFVVTTLFDLAWVFTPEAYPTEVRSFGYGMCSAMARISGVVAPFVALPLYDAAPWGVIALFSSVFAVTAIVSSRLPFETKDRPLSERVEVE
jgi:MFS transporter, putative metabolite:H+ symporter